jgi:hypothetical protein
MDKFNPFRKLVPKSNRVVGAVKAIPLWFRPNIKPWGYYSGRLESRPDFRRPNRVHRIEICAVVFYCICSKMPERAKTN